MKQRRYVTTNSGATAPRSRQQLRLEAPKRPHEADHAVAPVWSYSFRVIAAGTSIVVGKLGRAARRRAYYRDGKRRSDARVRGPVDWVAELQSRVCVVQNRYSSNRVMPVLTVEAGIGKMPVFRKPRDGCTMAPPA
jgi:hypothetical protein